MSLIQSVTRLVKLIVSTARAYRGDPNAWESTITDFENQDRLQLPPANPVVFTGSSSITFWTTLESDMAPLPVINRGFGGSRIGEVARYANRIVIPYRPWAVVLFAGTNDIAPPTPAAPETVFEGYRAFVDTVLTTLPATQIFYIGITPSRSRWTLWPVAQAANQLIAAHAATDPRLHFIDLTHPLLASDGLPNRQLYRWDNLHPNVRGYQLWTTTIKPILMAVRPDIHP